MSLNVALTREAGRAANAVIPNNLVKKSRLFIVLDVINVLG